MQEKAYKTLKELEGSWWHKGRVYALCGALKKLGVNRKFNRILDVGAGYGGMLNFLQQYGNVIDAVELYEEAKTTCDARGYMHTWHSLSEVSGTYNLAGAFDVVEHVREDKVFLRTIADVIHPGGIFIATVPAFQFLWSQHDVTHKHFRRYTVKNFSELVTKAGFDVLYCKYWNVALFFPAALLRLCNKTGESSLRSNSSTNSLFSAIVRLEAKVLPHAPTFCGTGIILVAQKPLTTKRKS